MTQDAVFLGSLRDLNFQAVRHDVCNGHSEPPGQSIKGSAVTRPTNAVCAATSKMDRWLSRAGVNSEKLESTPSCPVHAKGGTGGVSACCNLIHLLDTNELLQVDPAVLSVGALVGFAESNDLTRSRPQALTQTHGDRTIVPAYTRARTPTSTRARTHT